MSLVGEPEASVIVRVWFEDYPAHPIRFVVSTVGLGVPELRRGTTSIDDACVAVREALVALAAAGLPTDRANGLAGDTGRSSRR